MHLFIPMSKQNRLTVVQVLSHCWEFFPTKVCSVTFRSVVAVAETIACLANYISMHVYAFVRSSICLFICLVFWVFTGWFQKLQLFFSLRKSWFSADRCILSIQSSVETRSANFMTKAKFLNCVSSDSHWKCFDNVLSTSSALALNTP